MKGVCQPAVRRGRELTTGVFHSLTMPMTLSVLLFAWSLAWAGQKPAQVAGVGVLFEKSCYSCHNIGGGDKTGPDLVNVTERRTREWLHRFVLSPKDVKNSGDRTAVELFAKYAPEVMPDQVLSNEQIAQILDMIQRLSQKKQTFIPQTGRLSRQPTPRDIPAGRTLFTGRTKLARGGPACITCHSAWGVGYLSGGALGPDLTNIARKYKEVELANILKAPAFPMMSKMFGDRELSDEEVVKLFAFLRSVGTRQSDAARAGWAYLILGAVGAVALFGFTGLLWRGRSRGVRKELLRKAR